MIRDRMFSLGAFFMLGLLLAAQALHWFITPVADTASSARMAGVTAQALLGCALSVWAYVRARQVSSAPNRA